MDELRIQELPSLRRPTLIAAFAGWPDAAEVASGSARYLTRKLRAGRFAEIDPEPFYVFTETRPTTIILAPGQRALEWPSNEFFSWRDPLGQSDLIILQGREPNLNWRGYLDSVLLLVERCDVARVITLGGTYDAVAHRGGVQLTGHATTPELRRALERQGVHASDYEGPSSVQSALLDACQRRGLPAASVWGHAPHYVQAVPNSKVSHAMLHALRSWLDLDLDLGELREAGHQLESRVDEAIAENPRLREYVDGLGISIDTLNVESPTEEPVDTLFSRPDPADVLRDLEELLRRRQQDTGDKG